MAWLAQCLPFIYIQYAAKSNKATYVILLLKRRIKIAWLRSEKSFRNNFLVDKRSPNLKLLIEIISEYT